MIIGVPVAEFAQGTFMTIRRDNHLASSPKVPVAGYEDMLLNLSGAHAPFFTVCDVRFAPESGRSSVRWNVG